MPISRKPKRIREQRGYTLLMVVFMVATVLILAAMAAPNLLTQGRREREAEMVWRGEQYERAVGLYYRKFGKYPTKVDDLVKQTNGVRFLRQAYTDPMNKEDGSWRFIYVGPSGQLIGSTRHISLLQSALAGPAVPVTTVTGATGPVPGTPSAAMTYGAAGLPGAPAGANDQTLGANPLESQPQPLGGMVMGGNIIGVGSKIKESSIRLYEGGDTYEQWEFVWNPNQLGTGIPTAQPVNPAAPAAPGPGVPGAASGAAPPFGGTPAPGTAPPPDTTTPAQGTTPPPTQ